jgi:hypothetical protein
MRLFNYSKLYGAFINSSQLIKLSLSPKDRQERKMLEEANELIARGWVRRMAYLQSRLDKADEKFDEQAERAAFFPQTVDGDVLMPLQYLQDYMVRKIAAVQNNTSIHNKKEVCDLKEVFDEYGVELTPTFSGLVFDHISWSARPGQKPKLMVHTTQGDVPVVIRFEAASELCQKFLNVAITVPLKKGNVLDMSVEAVDPGIARNKTAGRKVADEGKYVNHNVAITVGASTHTGHPPKGTRFVQKPTIEQLEALFQEARNATEAVAA